MSIWHAITVAGFNVDLYPSSFLHSKSNVHPPKVINKF